MGQVYSHIADWVSGIPFTGSAGNRQLIGFTKCGDSECAKEDCRLNPDDFAKLREDRTAGLSLDENCYNFVVVGMAGVGKSSLVNGLRLLSDSDDGTYAQVGDVSDCTHELQQYQYPAYPHIRLFDAPGGGTDEHPEHCYFFDKSCYVFDCILLVNQGSMRSLDMSVVRSALAWNIPCAIIRTQCDSALIDLKRRQRTASGQQLKAILRDNTEKLMLRKSTELGLGRHLLPPVFHVSSTVYQYDDCKQYEMDESSLLAWLAVTALRSRNADVDLFKRNPLPDIGDNVCPICLENFGNVVLGPCGHTICRKCSEDWTQDCSLCRGPIERVFHVEMPTPLMARASAPHVHPNLAP